jgi:hypothetical protein
MAMELLNARATVTICHSKTQDLQTLDLPTVGSTGIKIYDVMRIFTGDNPARQFECGQQ